MSGPPDNASQRWPRYDRSVSYGLSTPPQHCPPIKESVRGLQTSSDHPPYLGFKFQYPGKEPKRDGSPMPDCLCCLVKTIVGSLPIENPDAQQRQQRGIIYLRPIDHTEPFVRSTIRSHSAPRIIWAHNQSSKCRFGKTSFHQRWCAAVSSSPSLRIPWKVSWVICKILLSVSTSRNEEGNYLDCRWVMSPPR